MQTNAIHLWRNRAATLVLAALAALSGTYWWLKSTDANRVSTVVPATTAGFSSLDPQAVARALGGGITAAVHPSSGASAPAGRAAYVLVGVVADRSLGGAALISVDGKAAKPYRVGDAVDGDLVLKSVAGRRAILAVGAHGPAQMTLELPALSR